jgi:hypothetical protein
MSVAADPETARSIANALPATRICPGPTAPPSRLSVSRIPGAR